jgi:hypothetical protein
MILESGTKAEQEYKTKQTLEVEAHTHNLQGIQVGQVCEQAAAEGLQLVVLQIAGRGV